MTFYGTMILEGMIAMIWAAAAMGLYNSGSTAGATAAVGEVAKGLLGPVGGIIAILGVIVLPITSGDTALRSCRLMIADYIHYDQRKKKEQSDPDHLYVCSGYCNPCICKTECGRI